MLAECRAAASAVFLALSTLVAASHANSAQPLATDDAAVLDPMTCQLETWLGTVQNGREYWVLPACTAFDRLELSAGGARVTDRDEGSSSVLLLQAKTVLFRRSDKAWSVGAVAAAQRDTGTSHGSSAFQTSYAKMLGSLYPSPRIEVDVNFGVKHARDAGTYPLANAAIQYAALDNVQLLAEVFRDERRGTKYQTGVRLIVVPNRFEAYVSYGNRFDASNEWWTIAGIRLQTARLP